MKSLNLNSLKEEEKITKAYKDLKIFNKVIFPKSFEFDFIFGKHLDEWDDLMQNNKISCILSARKHSKSNSTYGYTMWKVFQAQNRDLEILYLSYKDNAAAYHTALIDKAISRNPYFKQLKKVTVAESVLKYTWDGKHRIDITPAGILSFKRGRHPDIVILDDVLADPTTMLDLSVINKINRIVFEDVFSLPKEGGEIKIIGTAQTPADFFFKLRTNPKVGWGKYPAIKSYTNKEVLWPDFFPFERLIEIRDHEIGEKAFMKEYMIEPIYAAESYFTRDQIENISVLKPDKKQDNKFTTLMGWDIGKKTHPSHIAIFEDRKGTLVQVFQRFLDGWDYTAQVKYVKKLEELYKVDKIFFDNTRGEIEGWIEQGELDLNKYYPITFTVKNKHKMATQFEKLVSTDRIRLINDARQIGQIVTVTNDLDAIETAEGHGDSFWSIALAIGNYEIEGSIEFLEI